MQVQSTVNKVMLAGRIISDPSYLLKNGETTLNFAMVTREEIRKNGHTETIEEIHDVKVKGNVINIDKLQKQMPVYIQGRLQTVQYTDEAHIRRYKTFIIAHVIEILDF